MNNEVYRISRDRPVNILLVNVKTISRLCLSYSFPFASQHGVLMVIQPMRFIDNGRTVPQVLKASPVNPFFEPSLPGDAPYHRYTLGLSPGRQ